MLRQLEYGSRVLKDGNWTGVSGVCDAVIDDKLRLTDDK